MTVTREELLDLFLDAGVEPDVVDGLDPSLPLARQGVDSVDYPAILLAIMLTAVFGPGIVNALYERPCMLHRFPTGVTGEKVHQKRLPKGAPDWMETVHITFPTKADWDFLGDQGFLLRQDRQYHWRNQGYATLPSGLPSKKQPISSCVLNQYSSIGGPWRRRA